MPPPTLPRAQKTQPQAGEGINTMLQKAPTINPAQRRSHPRVFFLPLSPGCKARGKKHINNASKN